MHLDKRIIQRKFNVASASYDEVAQIQKEAAKILSTLLITCLPSFSPKSILDLGTGTGAMVECLLSIFPNSHYTLNDIAPNMLECAKRKLESGGVFKFEGCLGDMEQVCFDFHELIISNFAVQWAHNLEKLLEKNYLNSNCFAFSCLLSNTFKEWTSLLESQGFASAVPHYPVQSQIESSLLALNPKQQLFCVKDFKLSFKNAAAFITYLKKLGAAMGGGPVVSFNQALAFTEFIKNHDHQLTLTYQVFFGILKREK